MQIGAVSFRPYIYNANRLSVGSLSKVSGISDDLTTGKTDFSALADESLNENPLKKGQTLNFKDVLNRQFFEGRQNASRIMKSVEEMENLRDSEEVSGSSAMAKESVSVANEVKASVRGGMAGADNSAKEQNIAKVREDFKPAESAAGSTTNGTGEMLHLQSGGNLFQMQRAIEAYQMNMTA